MANFCENGKNHGIKLRAKNHYKVYI